MNRADLQQLAEMRMSDARALLATGANDSGAYYMAGYGVECALKAVIAKNQGEYPFPPRLTDRELTQKYYTHDLVVLLKTADLEKELTQAWGSNLALKNYWGTVTNWNEEFRYNPQVTRKQAEDLIEAVGDATNGVLQWLRNYW